MRLLKTYLPRRLYARAALILIVPILTLQIVVSVTFLQRHFEDVTRQMTLGVVVEAQLIAETLTNAPSTAEGRAAAEELAGVLGVQIALLGAPTPPDNKRTFYDVSGRTVIATLRDNLPDVRQIDLASNDRELRFGMGTPRGELQMVFSRRRVSASNPHQLLVLMILVGVLMTLIAYLFLRNQLRPIARLSAAAEEFGKGRTVPYRPAGAVEVRAAGHAFLDMRNRIERQIEQRTLMLSGVSHDLRTPLTRMRLELSLLDPSPEVEALQKDVSEMARLLDAFLDFARSDAMEEPQQIDPAKLVSDAVERARRGGGQVDEGEVPQDNTVSVRVMAVERALDNLIGNALRYGTRAHVSLTVMATAIRFCIEDDGPGIPAEEREMAMKPFARLDQSRNQNRGSGVGLGLAIAADVARSHGGSLRLGDSERLGGLRVDLVLAR